MWANVERSEGKPLTSTTQSKPEAVEPTSNPAIAIAGRYAVGVHAWKPTDQADALKVIVDQLDSAAKTVPDHIDVAIVSREVESPKDADARFATLNGDQHLTNDDRDDLDTLSQIDREGPDNLSATQRSSLVARHGWFGRLALTHGLPENNPVRLALLGGTHRTIIVFAAGGVIGTVVLLLGICLMVVAIVMGATGRLSLRYVRAFPPGTAYLEAFVIYMVGFLVISLGLRAMLAEPSIAWTFVAAILLPIVLIWPVMRGESWSSVKRHFGWHRGAGVLTEMGVGIATYVTFLPVLGGALLVTGLLMKIAEHFHWVGATPSHPITGYLTGSPGTIVLVYLLASVFAPLMEETMFRGALFHHLRGRHGWWVSAVVVSLIFAAIHPQGWTVIPPLATLSMVFCAMRDWRSSLIASMTAHALSNAIVITLSVLLLR